MDGLSWFKEKKYSKIAAQVKAFQQVHHPDWERLRIRKDLRLYPIRDPLIRVKMLE